MPQSPVNEISKVVVPPKAEKKPVKRSDWYKLGKSKRYKGVNEALEARKEQIRRNLPTGEKVQNADSKDLAHRWAIACAQLAEIEQIQSTIEFETRDETV